MRRRNLAAICVVIATAGVLLSPSAFSEARASATTVTSWPVKIFVCNTPRTRVDAALSNPYVAGISSRFSWAAIEPHPGEYRWAAIDRTLSLARHAGKRAMIRVIAGIYTPAWVDRRVATLTFSLTGPRSPTPTPTSTSSSLSADCSPVTS